MSLLSKAFSGWTKPAAATARPAIGSAARPIRVEPAPRRVIDAPVLADLPPQSSDSGGISILARIEEHRRAIVFLLDRPVLAGYSFWAPDRDTACACSPLAAAVFDVGGVGTVLLHDMTLTVTPAEEGTGRDSIEDFAREIGAAIRRHLQSGIPAVHSEVLESIPSEETIRARLQEVIDAKINPGVAAHSGLITLDAVQGNTAYITMGGGCQGCAAASITLRQGVEKLFREAVPELGALLDQTDHGAGKNPYFTAIPPEMEA